MKYIFTFLSLLLFSASYAEDAKEILKKMQAVYSKTDNLEYKCRYELFKGHQSTDIVSSYDGYLYKNKEQVFQQIDQAILVYGSDFFLKINNNEKAALLDKKQIFQSVDGDLDQALSECRSVEMEDKGTYFDITLTMKSISQIPYSMIKLRIEKKSYYLTQMDMYYSDQTDFSEDRKVQDMSQPHLKITFTDISLSPKDHKDLLSFSKYIVKNGKIETLNETYKNYELIDNRTK